MILTRHLGYFSTSVGMFCSSMSSRFPQTLNVSLFPLNVRQHDYKWIAFYGKTKLFQEASLDSVRLYSDGGCWEWGVAREQAAFQWQRLLVYHTLPPSHDVVLVGASSEAIEQRDVACPKVLESLVPTTNCAM